MVPVMLSHDWMRQRDRQIRRTVRDATRTDDDGLTFEAASEDWQPDPAEELAFAAIEPRGLQEPAAGDDPAAAPAEPQAEEPAVTPAPSLQPVPEAGREPELPVAVPGPLPALEPRRTAPELPEDIATAHPGMRQRLEAVLARQQQLPLDIEARRAFTAEAADSPRETREMLLQRLLDPTLTLQEAAVLLDVCPTTVRRYTDRGVLRCFRTPGNQRRFHLSDVLDLMERQSRPLV